MRAAQIALIISTYERPDALNRVLEGVIRQSELPGEIVIADDGSGEPTKELIERWKEKLAPPVRHVRHDHEGFRKTIILNKAISVSKARYIVMLDGDCVPHPRFLADHALLAEKNFWVQGRRAFVREEFVTRFSVENGSRLLWALTGRISGPFKSLRLPWPIVRRDFDQRGIIGCNMGLWKDDLLAINGFDEEFIGWGGEDSDLGTRLYNLGRPRKLVHGRAIIYHLNHPTLSRSNYEAARQRLAETIDSKRVRCERGLDGHKA